MYSVVLLMALTTGGEVAEARGCRGCRGCSCGCYSCGCYGGCYGCRGCYGGCYSYCGCYGGYSYGCYCGGYSYGCYGCYSYGCGCYGGCYAGCYAGCGAYGGGMAISGGAGGYVIAQPAPAAPSNAATVVVTVPTDAKVTIDGEATASTSAVRTFVSPSLTPGKKYSYTVKAEFQKDGQPVVVSKKVLVEANRTSRIDLRDTATGVASK
jgi:uncharacterized protein (TIGR03000 family)